MQIIPEQHNKVWGYEEWLCNTEKYCGKFLYINKNAELSLHFHSSKDEVFICLDGVVILTVIHPDGSNSEILMEKGSPGYRIFPNTPHTVRAIEKAIILEISSHHEDSDSYRITYSKPGEE